jgi:UDP-N-acetylmuramoylalanine--D-glutamate ligase
VAAVTGSNGKSTVTTMVAAAAVRAGRQMPAGGNLGTPALNLLDMPAEGYLLELSSFQLELTESLRPRVAAVLNISVDHIDRHGSLDAYAAAKAKILMNAECAVLNRCDPLVMAMARPRRSVVTFGGDVPSSESDYGVVESNGRKWLARGEDRLMPADEIGVPGAHNLLNALAAIAIADRMGISGEPLMAALRAYRGLPHRTQVVAEVDGIRWIDDSKATNIGAAIAAITGMESPLVLIAGGEGKGADFEPLAEAVRGKARAVVLLGRDAPLLADAIGSGTPWEIVSCMEDAVAAARKVARTGDIVLLSPACASLDMFTNYAARGEAFRLAVLGARP